MHLIPWTKLFCETLIVAQIFKQPQPIVEHEIQELTTIRVLLSWTDEIVLIITTYLLKICFNVFSPFMFWTQFSHFFSVRFEVLIVVTEKYCRLCYFMLISLSFTWPYQDIWWRVQLMMLLVMQCSLVSVASCLVPNILLRMLFVNTQANVPGLLDLKVDLYWLFNETYDYKCRHLVVWTLIICENSLYTVMKMFLL